jgi:hypothetical protein
MYRKDPTSSFLSFFGPFKRQNKIAHISFNYPARNPPLLFEGDLLLKYSFIFHLGEGVDGDRRAHGGHHDAVRHSQVHHEHVRGCPAQKGKTNWRVIHILVMTFVDFISVNIHKQFLRQI